MENRLKRRYKNGQGNMFSAMRRSNPKRFYRKFKKRRKAISNCISIEQFVDHFKSLMSGNDNNGVQDDNFENVFEDLDKPFSEKEIENCVNKLKRNKSPGEDNILNEYILESKTVILPVLCKLFNVILVT